MLSAACPSRWVVWPLPAHATARAEREDPPIVPSPSSKSLLDDLGFTLRSQEGNPVLAAQPSTADAPLPIYSPQHHSCLSSCPHRPEEPGSGQHFLNDLGHFFSFVFISFCKKRKKKKGASAEKKKKSCLSGLPNH